MSNWIKAISYADLQGKQRTVLRHQGKQIALFLTEQGVLACNNRCPHEGYPLSEGTLDNGSLANSCQLTCNWHSWTFDLKTGANLYGGDQLRVYPTELRADGAVWVDLAEPPFEQRQAGIFANLREAFDDHDYERLARELARLRLLGADPLDAVRAAIEWSYQRLEFGWTHAYAGAADWLSLYDEHAADPATQLVCLQEILGHIADDVLRESDYPYSEQVQAFEEDAFVAAIDAKNETAAIAMLRGALADGLHFPALERGLSRAALLHYNNFGHALIYVTKAGDLIARLGEPVELPLLVSLIRSLIFARREDLIPEFRQYATALADWGQVTDSAPPSIDVYRTLTVNKALRYTVQHSATPPSQLFQILLGANAGQMLHFDMHYQFQTDRPVSDNVGWLDFTHGITFANAVHKQCRKFPELWPAGLLQMACFSGRNKPYTDASLNASEWAVEDDQAFLAQQTALLFDHGKDEYIVSVHLLKTLLAVREELELGASAETRQLMIAALNRFLHAPLKRKHTRRSARQAMAFVALDG